METKKFFLVFLSILLLIAICVVVITTNLRPTTSSPDNSNKVDPQVTVLPNPTVIVESVRQLAKLETISMTFQRQFSSERNQELWGLFGERLVFDAYGQVIAGVDLSQIEISDVEVVDNQTIRIFMPKTEIFQVVLDNERSSVLFRLVGPFTSADYEMETQVRLEAQQNLLDCAHQSGILLMAQLNAENALRDLMHQLGFVVVEFYSK